MRKSVVLLVAAVGAFTVACSGGADEKTATTDQAMMCLNCGDGTSSGGGGGGGGGYTPVGPNVHIGVCNDSVSGATAGDFSTATQGSYWALHSVDPNRWAHDDYVVNKGWALATDQPYFLMNNSTGGAWYALQVSRNSATAARNDSTVSSTGTTFGTYVNDPVVRAHVVNCAVTDPDTGITTTTYWLVDDPNCSSGCAPSHTAS